MVQVKSSSGKTVKVEILGINEVRRLLLAKGQQIKAGADFGVIRAGTFIQEEVKESIIGNRVEHKSVDTGRLANSIEFVKTGNAQGIVKPKRSRYPNSNQTTEDVAGIIEYSDRVVGGPRLHFKNTEVRNRKKIIEMISIEIKAVLAKSIRGYSSIVKKFIR